MTFKELYLSGQIPFEEIDRYISRWNRSDDERTLAKYLGLNAEEEDVWIDNSDDALKEMLDARERVVGTPVTLGKTDIIVNKNGFGALPIQRISFDEAKTLLCKAYDAGVRFFDTARFYTDSEEKIGYALSDVRDHIYIATKTAAKNEEEFWKLLDQRLELCKEALMCRHYALLGTTSDISPIHWQNGAIARLKKGEKIDKYLKGGYSTMSLGYIGVYETTKLMKGVSQTTPEGHDFAIKIMKYLKERVERWKKETTIGFALYGTPAESLCYRFARIDKERFGDIEDVTDKGYYTNSYHVDVREKIDAFSKLKFESEFQNLSTGGAISYVEVPNMKNNLTALEEVVKFIYDNIQYAEFNTKSDYCQVCGYDGEMLINDNNEWECPQCGNKDKSKLNVVRRTCGYLGENFWNVGKTKEIKSRVMHL